MKKIIKKSKYILITGLVFALSFILSSEWFNSPVEKAIADASSCIPPREQFANGCFSPTEVATWIAGGGDTGGGGDTSGS